MHVLFVHGMGRTVLSLYLLERAVRRDGHHVHRLGYVAAVESFDRIVRRVRHRIDALAESGQPYALVGHSLGGVLLRAALAEPPAVGRAPAHLIMLGTPNRSPRLARRLHRVWLYRRVHGDCGQRLADASFLNNLPPPAAPYTIIAGTAGWQGRWSPFGSEPNDGVVARSETLIQDTDVPIVMPVLHTFIMNHRRVHEVICDVLATYQEVARSTDLRIGTPIQSSH